jgi:hypothetical protein
VEVVEQRDRWKAVEERLLRRVQDAGAHEASGLLETGSLAVVTRGSRQEDPR